MSRKTKGLNAERDLVHKFWKTGKWAAIRVAGSGSMRYPSCDVLATNKIRTLAIECKTSGRKVKYLGADDVDQILTFSKLFQAEPYIAVKFDRKEWLFLSLDDIPKVGITYAISVALAENKGLLLEEVIC